ncbi:hypothetical protein M3Y94_00509100 [Aphelenchoides besseyi]|nr:hypothetical protein M3Y94_00509100 [Aphelenchoides besseyi]
MNLMVEDEDNTKTSYSWSTTDLQRELDHHPILFVSCWYLSWTLFPSASLRLFSNQLESMGRECRTFMFDVNLQSGFVVSVLCELVALFLMFKAAKSVRGEKGQVIDAGMDLNDPQAFGEYFKDTIILCVIIQFAALLSTYFLGLLFIFPSFATYKLWVGVIGPWIFAPAPEPDPMDEKRQKRRQKVVYRH